MAFLVCVGRVVLVPPSTHVKINVTTTEVPFKPDSFIAYNALVQPGALR